jgi:16S rRNA processing protein RimM
MDHPDFFEFGKILKTHGHQGWLKGLCLGNHLEDYKKMESLFLLDQELPVPFFVETISWKGQHFLIKLKDINTMEAANQLVGNKILLPASQLPALKKGEYFLHDLIGMEVLESSGQILGKVVSYFDQTAQSMVEVNYNGQSLLLPLAGDILKNIDLEKRTIEVDLPEDYIEILGQG